MCSDIFTEEKPASPTKSDTMRSTDMSSAGDTLDERSSKEVRKA